MTQEERQMLSTLADKIAQTPAPQRDKEAEDLIRTRIGNRPDALYIMTQTVLVQNLALEQAKAQLERLQQQANAGAQAGSGSFLGGQPATSARPVAPAASGSYAPSQPYIAGTAPAAPAAGGGASSFLRSAATTAAGVAAGALAFEGIESLLGHHGGLFGGGYGEREGFLGGAGPGGETIINNYYDSPGAADRDDRPNDLAGLGPSDDDQYADADQLDDSDTSVDDGGDDYSDDGGSFS